MKPLQKKRSNEEISAKKANKTGIPAQMKERMEEKSGFSFDDVRVHYNSDRPAQLQALAYTQGSDVYVGPGQERHLPHELGHVVQQKSGIVQATETTGGMRLNTDPGLEHAADQIAQMYRENDATVQREALPEDEDQLL